MTNPGLDLQITLAKWLARTVAPYLPPVHPHPVSLIFVRKESPTMLVFALKLTPPAIPVAKRTLTVTVNGTAQPSFEATDGMELKFQAADVVSLTLVDTSEAGIDSAPSAPFNFTPGSLVPPATPEAPSVTFLREEADPTPTPAETPVP